jgi:DNA polymerase I
MKRIVDGVAYNTDTSTWVARKSATRQDEKGREVDEMTILFQTAKGAYFLHKTASVLLNVRNNEKREADEIIPMTADEARTWMLNGDVQVIHDPFAEGIPEAEPEAEQGATIYLRVPASLKQRVEAAADQANRSCNAWIIKCLEVGLTNPRVHLGPVRPLKPGDRVFLVHASSYIFRAYHALPPINRKSDGLQLNVVFGFCNMLLKLLHDMKAEEKPTHLAVLFDKSEKTFRSDIYPNYKVHRPDPPDDLRPQFKLIREAAHAFDLPCLEQDSFEAKDLIATYARQASAAGANTTIVSSDRHFMQLVNDSVTMFDTMKDQKIGIPEVIQKFGVPPDKVIDVEALVSDSIDNIPGVPGIGMKTAAQLITEYGDLETLLKRADEIILNKRRQTLIENTEAARISKRLVTLADRVPLDVKVADLAVHEPDYKRVIAFLKAMEFISLTRRVAERSGVDANAVAPSGSLKATRLPVRARGLDDAAA